MAEHGDESTLWTGRELFDANAERIGVIAGPGYSRKKFGTYWLLVENAAAHRVLVPADQISSRGERLVLPYPRTYVEGAPAVEQDRPLTPAEERRLRLHYGMDSGAPNAGCQAGCGLCQARRRAERRSRAG
jgi:hypothetical protein